LIWAAVRTIKSEIFLSCRSKNNCFYYKNICQTFASWFDGFSSLGQLNSSQLNSSPPLAAVTRSFSKVKCCQLWVGHWYCSGLNCAWKKPLYLTIAWVLLFFFIPSSYSIGQLFNYHVFPYHFLCVPTAKSWSLRRSCAWLATTWSPWKSLRRRSVSL